MSTPIQDIVSLAAKSVVEEDPWAFGTLDVPSPALDVFYADKAGANARFVHLAEGISVSALDELAKTCEPATFGKGGEDVLDEAYRKAGKLDNTRFAPLFDVSNTGVLAAAISGLGRDPDERVHAELYKLNVYGEGSFFRPHKDTPRNEKMFGSLVVVFPTVHEGGELALNHGDRKMSFDSSQLLKEHEGENKIAWISFFSDVEHEVLPVTRGHRVTLTYNLYDVEPHPQLSIPSSEKVATLKSHLQTLLDNPTFLPEGGLLGFGLNFSYPVSSNTPYNNFLDHLKGSDVAVKLACIGVGLTVSLMGLVDDPDPYSEPGYRAALISSARSEKEGFILEEEVLDYIRQKYRGIFVHEMGREEHDKKSKPICWITEKTANASVEIHYTAYGNEPAQASYYSHVCLIAAVGPHGDRSNAAAFGNSREPASKRRGAPGAPRKRRKTNTDATM
ncbi:hypothetical protein DL96DRAFT_1817580 [Flagelloscypha sp. PMI_526]|nr:hypothetical protein DL96DRAFT_1817580 [Flagelloscypha sp. PMI_526]